MTNNKLKTQIRYWLLSASHDYDTMLGLFELERYSDSLFYGHIVLEKSLKALVVAESKKLAPLIHDLTTLAELAKIELENDEKSLLAAVKHFNITSRYPDYKLDFYLICDYAYTISYLDSITLFYKKICQHPKLK